MADDRTDQSQGSGDANAERLRELAEKHGGMSPGMTSPDSTQMPLRADTGEPDEDAAGGRSRPAQRDTGGSA